MAKKKKAEKIDRKKKTIKIGKYRIATDQFCIGLLILIMALSSFGMFAGRRSAAPQTMGDLKVSIDFGNYTRVNKIVQVRKDMTAEDAFREIANLTTAQSQTGEVVTGVSANGTTKLQNGAYLWVFYVNGVLTFKDINSYPVQPGQVIELRYEKNPY